ncbi:MAG TPA: cobalamin biosynthesis protein CbiX [Opitutaceae bacterium]|nr:cobalamin biosynthesis protein CbiX [Opitutaceae bacterium]
MPNARPPPCYLFDNGSLRAASTLSLRRIATWLQARLPAAEVRPASLLHSSAVDPAELGGRPAELLLPALEAALVRGESDFVLLPLFFGPSAALTIYLPERLQALRKKFPALQARVARGLVDTRAPGDRRIARILADGVRRAVVAAGWRRPRVVLADHGSPEPGVTAVRDFLGGQLRVLLEDEVAAVAVASMELRPGPEYAFGAPLLADLLRSEVFGPGEVVVALQFLSPGRHAGPNGDVVEICAAAERFRRGLRIRLTGLVGEDERLADLLADRYREAAG